VKGTAGGRRATSVSTRSSTSSGRANPESDQRVRIHPLPRGVQCELGFLGRSPSIAVGRTASRLRAYLEASGHGAVIDGPATPPIDSAMRRLPSSWLIAIRAAGLRALSPDAVIKLFDALRYEKLFYFYMGITLVLGLYLTYAGFSP
jgi:hypothetical protein